MSVPDVGRITAIERPLDLAYRAARPLLFRLDAESVHDRVMAGLALASRSERLTALLGAAPDSDDDARLAIAVNGLRLAHPVGVAAGLDKNAVAVPALAALGFSHVEVGTITPLPQRGNPKPRVFRLPEDAALINRMGFPGRGVETVEATLRAYGPGYLVGCNIGPNRASVESGQAGDDLASLSRRLSPLAAYLAVNVSSPNTAKLRDLQGARALRALLEEVLSAQPLDARPPVLVKIAPDLTEPELDAVVATAQEAGIAGIVATNTTLARPSSLRGRHRRQAGGLSGAPLRAPALDVVCHLARRITSAGGPATGDTARPPLTIVAVGGITTGRDVVDAVAAGASMVQVYTAFVYRGPTLARALKREMLDELNRRNVDSLADLLGTDG